MEILQVAVSKLKSRFSELVEAIYVFNNYGIKSCNTNIMKSHNSVKLELIFLMNVEYVCLSKDQLFKIQNNSFKNLFKKESFPELSTKMSLI